MTLDKLIVILAGAVLIAFVYWFFLMKKRTAVAVSDAVDIEVNGGYSPEIISIPKGQKTMLNFTRTDANSCLEEVVLGDFGVRRTLPLNEKVSVELTPQAEGEYTYSCGMGMFHGKIVVTK